LYHCSSLVVADAVAAGAVAAAIAAAVVASLCTLPPPAVLCTSATVEFVVLSMNHSRSHATYNQSQDFKIDDMYRRK
jgi:hypothetical protein